MKIRMSFEGDGEGSVEITVEAPTRWTFAKMATSLWHTYRDLRRAVEARGTEDPLAIVVTAWGENMKIQSIKAIREITGLGLKEAKDFVEAAAPGRPQIVRVDSPDARKTAMLTLRQAGATVEPLRRG